MKNLSRHQKAKYIMITSFFVANIILLIISFRMNIDDLKFSIRVARYIPYIRYIVLLNILLVVSILTMYYLEANKIKKNHEANQEELARMKSKLYDFWENQDRIKNEEKVKS